MDKKIYWLGRLDGFIKGIAMCYGHLPELKEKCKEISNEFDAYIKEVESIGMGDK